MNTKAATQASKQSTRNISVKDGCRILTVYSLEDLKIVLSPQRQRIMKLLQVAGKPLHGKEIADRIGIKAPSAHFHLRKLKDVGAVRISHTESINGITATFYEPAVDMTVAGDDFLMGADGCNDEAREKLQAIGNVFTEGKNRFIRVLENNLNSNQDAGEAGTFAQLYDAVLYMSPEEAEGLCAEIDSLIRRFSEVSPGKEPYGLLVSACKNEN
jgi:predicted transcriptional regulator